MGVYPHSDNVVNKAAHGCCRVVVGCPRIRRPCANLRVALVAVKPEERFAPRRPGWFGEPVRCAPVARILTLATRTWQETADRVGVDIDVVRDHQSVGRTSERSALVSASARSLPARLMRARRRT